MIRARLIAIVKRRWFLALVPLTRRGKILPRSEMNRFNNSVSHSVTTFRDYYSSHYVSVNCTKNIQNKNGIDTSRNAKLRL